MFDITTAADRGWSTMRNGKLLVEVERAGFDVFLTGDKSLADENVIAGREIGVVTMSDNHWRNVRDYVPAVVEALATVKHGEVLPVFCGRFLPRRGQGGPRG